MKVQIRDNTVKPHGNLAVGVFSFIQYSFPTERRIFTILKLKIALQAINHRQTSGKYIMPTDINGAKMSHEDYANYRRALKMAHNMGILEICKPYLRFNKESKDIQLRSRVLTAAINSGFPSFQEYFQRLQRELMCQMKAVQQSTDKTANPSEDKLQLSLRTMSKKNGLSKDTVRRNIKRANISITAHPATKLGRLHETTAPEYVYTFKAGDWLMIRPSNTYELALKTNNLLIDKSDTINSTLNSKNRIGNYYGMFK